MRLVTAPLLALALVGVAAPSPATASDDVSGPLRGAIDAAASAFSGSTAIVVADPRRGTAYERDAGRVFPAASLYKLAVMVEAYRQAAAGTISLDGSTITIEDEDQADGGVLTAAGTVLTVRDAVELMITASDNACAEALLRTLDPHRVNDAAAALGLRDTRVNTALPAEERTADANTTSARDLVRLFSALVKGTVVDPAASAEMLAVLGRQRINDRLPTGLPAGTAIAHKTGNLDEVAHDAGIVTTPFGPRVVVVLTADYGDYGEVIDLAAAVARAAFTLPLDRFAATVAPTQAPHVAPGAAFAVAVRVTNDSSFAWDLTFHLDARWRGAPGTALGSDGAPTALPPLRPGESAMVLVRGRAPAASDRPEVLELDVVEDGVGWAGSPALVSVELVEMRD